MSETPPSDILDTPAAGGAAIRGSLFRLLGYGSGVALGIVSAALLIRHLGPSDFGRYTAVFSLVTIVATIAEGGITTIGIREYSTLAVGRRERFLGELAGLRILAMIAGAAIAVAFSVVAGYDREMVLGTVVTGLGMLVLAAQFSYAIPLHSHLRLGWVAALELVRQAATVAAIVALVAAGASLAPFFWVTAVGSLAALVATVPLVRGVVHFLPSFRIADWRRLIALTVPFGVANAVGAIYVYLAVVVLSLISTEEETGYFGASFRIFIVVGTAAGLLVGSAFPILARAARDDEGRLAYALGRLWQMQLLLGAGVALCTAVGAELAIDVVAGDGFEPSVRVLQIQAAALLPTYLIAVGGFGLLSLGYYRAILLANLAAFLVSLVLTLVLGERYGATGAAFATVFGETTLASVYAISLLRRRPDLGFVSAGFVARVAAASAVAGAVLLVPDLDRVVRLVAVALVYVATAWLLRAVPPEVPAAFGLRRAE